MNKIIIAIIFTIIIVLALFFLKPTAFISNRETKNNIEIKNYNELQEIQIIKNTIQNINLTKFS